MGLFAEFDVINDFGYLEQTEQLGLIPDYGTGCQVFVETFLKTARELVPVDTGYLMTTLTANCSDTYCYVETNCEYAQYPEYGTWCQAAQPYFTPALEQAIMAAEPYWTQAQRDVQNEEAALAQGMNSQGSQGMDVRVEVEPLTKEDIGLSTPESFGLFDGTERENSSHFAGIHTSEGVYGSYDSFMDNYYMPQVNDMMSAFVTVIAQAVATLISTIFRSLLSISPAAPMGQVFIPEVIIT